MVETSQQISTAKGEETIVSYSEAELAVLGRFFAETAHSLLNVPQELVEKELNPAVLGDFASDKNQRTLVFAKIEKSASGPEESPQVKKEPVAVSTKIVVSNKVEFQGASTMAIAFIKREPHKHLYLKNQAAAENESKAASITSGGDEQPATIEDVSVDISSQLQVINLGYIGQDSNIFELASTYVDFSFLPLFQDFKSKSQGSTSQGTEATQGSAAGLDNILKGLSSLKMNLA